MQICNKIIIQTIFSNLFMQLLTRLVMVSKVKQGTVEKKVWVNI